MNGLYEKNQKLIKSMWGFFHTKCRILMVKLLLFWWWQSCRQSIENHWGLSFCQSSWHSRDTAIWIRWASVNHTFSSNGISYQLSWKIVSMRYKTCNKHILCYNRASIMWHYISINSSPLSAAYMRRWTGSTLVHVTASRLFGTKLLPEPMHTHCQLDPQEKNNKKFHS